MAFPALAAEAEARAIRTRAWGETGRGLSFAEGFAFIAADFFLGPTLTEVGMAVVGGVLSVEGSGVELLSGAGEVDAASAEGRIEADILLDDLLLPDGDLAIARE